MRSASMREIDRPISIVLLVGMLASIILMLVGVGLLISQDIREGIALLPPGRAIGAALAMNPGGWLSLGIFVLILTPVARVLMAIGSFAWIRDWKYVLVSVVVLAAMVAALLLGK